MDKKIRSTLNNLSPNASFLLLMILTHNDNINTQEIISLNPFKNAYYIMTPKDYEDAINDLLYHAVLKLADHISWSYWINSTIIWELTKYKPNIVKSNKS